MNRPRHAVRAEAFVLVPQTVTDLDDFAEHHDRYLVSADTDPAGAARRWHERLTGNPYGSDGFLALKYHGQELIAPELWDEVYGIWHSLLDITEAYLTTGAGVASFPGQPVDLELRGQGGGAVFRAGDRSTSVDPTEFVPGLLDEAERYLGWVETHVGDDESMALARVRALRARAASR